MKRAKDIRSDARLALNGRFFYVLGVILLSNFILVVLNVISIIMSGPLFVGLDYYILNMVRKKDPQIEDLLYSFKTSLGTSVVSNIVRVLIIFLFSLLLVIPGIVKMYQYFLTAFLIADDPSLTGMDALNKSKEMMKGHKMRLFKLHLSFFGWYILSILTLGIGFIFLIPYIYTANAVFYNDLGYQSQKVIGDDY